MKRPWIALVSILLTAGFAALPATARASFLDEPPPPAKDDAQPAKTTTMSHEFETEYSYSASSNIDQGMRNWGEIDSQHSEAKYVFSHSVDDGVLMRWGAHWDRFSFSIPGQSPLPNTLQSISAVIGSDIELADDWIMRVEMEPGIYSDFQDISFDDLNVPLIVGASYLVDKDLQWFFGMMVNPRSDWPVIPGVGVRWKFHDQWTLMFVLPEPRIEYEITPELTAFAGASFKAGNYQVAKDFGTNLGRTDLDNDNIDYREIRTGAGLSWKFLPGMSLEAEAGWVIDRRFEYRQSDLTLDSDGAPYGQISFTATF